MRSQWLGYQKPDANNVQFPVMIEAIQQLCELQSIDLDDAHVWLDIISIPQENLATQRALCISPTPSPLARFRRPTLPIFTLLL